LHTTSLPVLQILLLIAFAHPLVLLGRVKQLVKIPNMPESNGAAPQLALRNDTFGILPETSQK
jgi:hypothetical protein